MEQENRPAPKEDYRQVRRAGNLLAIRGLAVFYALYMLFQLVQGYVKGGDDAPTLLLLILGILFLGGGAAAIAIWSYRIYKRDRKQAMEPPEEEALEAEEPTQEPKDS